MEQYTKQHIENELIKSKENYRLLFENITEAFAFHEIVVNKNNEPVDYRFLDINPAFEQLTGLKRENIIGKTVLEVMPKTEKYWIERYGKVALENKIDEYTNYAQELDKYYHVKAFCPQKGLFAVTFTDVTEHIKYQQLLKKSEKKLKEALDFNTNINQTSPVSIVVVDKKGLITYANKKAEETLGIVCEDIITRKYNSPEWKITTIEGGHYPNEKLPFVIVSTTKKPVYDIRHSIEWPDGKLVHLSVNAMPQLNEKGEFVSMIATMENITEKVKAETKLKKYNERLHELNATKDKFFSIIAHDLKSPLANLMGIADLLYRNYKKYDDNKLERWIKEIYENTFKTYGLIENLLTWSQTQRDAISFTPSDISLYNLTDDAISFIGSVAEKKKISIDNLMEKSIQVYADKPMLETILRNLLSNAIKFTNPLGKVTITSKVESSGFVKISVIDNGVGIKKSRLNTMFSIENSISSSGTKGETGTGLGLILCKEFVEKHGGVISVESTPGKGSVFSFTVPASDKI